MSNFGYAGKILVIDLTTGRMDVLPTSDYADDYIGGRGLAVKLFHDLVPETASAFDPDNCLICATGPLTGVTGLAGCRWVLCGKSPLRSPQMFSYGNLGGRWGSVLKFTGYDALVVRGSSDRPVYLTIFNDCIETIDASSLWGLTTFETEDRLKADHGKHASILTIGPAAENLVVFATAFADGGASASGGVGPIMGSKNLKAIVVSGNNRPSVADPDTIHDISRYVKSIRSATFNAPSPWAIPGVTKPENCFGCGIGCTRQSYKIDDNRRYKSFCQAGTIYGFEAMRYYGKRNDIPLMATRLCDAYGLDTVSTQPMISWLYECYREGIISETETGLPFSTTGSAKFLESFIRMVAFRDGFGNILGDGTLSAAEKLGTRASELTTRFVGSQTNESRDYDPRMILTTAVLMATEPRKPVSQLHGISGNTMISWCTWNTNPDEGFLTTDDFRLLGKRFWGGEQSVDFSTWHGKALAAKMVQDRACAQESLVLCDVHWPMQVTSDDAPEGHVGDPALESRIYSAVTGKATTEQELYQTGERIFNLQRITNLLHGWNGKQGDTILDFYFTEPLKQGDVFFNPDGLMPGSNEEIISMLGKVLKRGDFTAMMDEYYMLRGWDTDTGVPFNETLSRLRL